MTINRICIVGGVNRDRILNELHGTTFPLHDVDISVEADSFEEMCDWATAQGGTIRTTDADFGTIKFTVPKNTWLHNLGSNAIDAVWCRIDGPTMDGRHPLWVKPATTEDDLSRRDFSVNAIGVQVVSINRFSQQVHETRVIDPHNGIRDCQDKILRFVGDPLERISEDGLRLVRAWRFMATRSLDPTRETWAAMNSIEAANMIGPGSKVSEDRVFKEMEAFFNGTDAAVAIEILSQMPDFLWDALFPSGGRLRLRPPLADKKG